MLHCVCGKSVSGDYKFHPAEGCCWLYSQKLTPSKLLPSCSQLMIAVILLATAGAGNLFSDAGHYSVFFDWISAYLKTAPHLLYKTLHSCLPMYFQPCASLTCSLFAVCTPGLSACMLILSLETFLFPLLLYTCRLGESLFRPTSKQSSQWPFQSAKLSFVLLMLLSVQYHAHPHLCWLIFFNLKQARVIWEEGT